VGKGFQACSEIAEHYFQCWNQELEKAAGLEPAGAKSPDGWTELKRGLLDSQIAKPMGEFFYLLISYCCRVKGTLTKSYTALYLPNSLTFFPPLKKESCQLERFAFYHYGFDWATQELRYCIGRTVHSQYTEWSLSGARVAL
jgi:hypothetical protein